MRPGAFQDNPRPKVKTMDNDVLIQEFKLLLVHIKRNPDMIGLRGASTYLEYLDLTNVVYHKQTNTVCRRYSDNEMEHAIHLAKEGQAWPPKQGVNC